jgi:hypothetical protein
MIALAAMFNGTHAVSLARPAHVSSASAKGASPSNDHAVHTNQHGSHGSSRDESLRRCNEIDALIELHRRLSPRAERQVCIEYESSQRYTTAYWERS